MSLKKTVTALILISASSLANASGSSVPIDLTLVHSADVNVEVTVFYQAANSSLFCINGLLGGHETPKEESDVGTLKSETIIGGNFVSGSVKSSLGGFCNYKLHVIEVKVNDTHSTECTVGGEYPCVTPDRYYYEMNQLKLLNEKLNISCAVMARENQSDIKDLQCKFNPVR